MPRNLQGLQGLKGLGGLSKAQYDNFINKNRDLIAQHGYDPMYINNLYSNKQFIDKYGVDNFKAIPDVDIRNKIYRDDIINTEFSNVFKNIKGFDYNRYNQLSTDAKLKLMESDYLTPSEFENAWQKRMKESAIERSGTYNSPSKTLAMPAGIGLVRSFNSMINAISKGRGLSEAIGLFTPGGEEAAKKVELDKNQRILDNIFSEDADNAATKYSSQVSQAYQELAGISDDSIKKAFIQAITPHYGKNSYNLGVPEYAKYFGNGSDNERKTPMDDFSIDDMRQVLAKKKVYDANMSPEMAMQALNNDAKRYATANEGWLRRFGLFTKDVGISALSYTADKVNGIYNLGLLAEDKLQGKPIVLVDDSGNVLDPNKTNLVKDRKGNLTYQGNDGRMHYVHRQQIDRTTLHNMGKNFDGSEDDGILNPQYWTRAEQFGTLDENEQKQYEKLGTSPYKVAYNPNEDSDLLYESFKMMSFGIADAASQLLPYGVGLFGKTLSAASKAGKVAQGFGKVLDTTGKLLTFESKTGQIAQGTAGALGIAYAYNRGAFQETLAQNLANTEEAVLNASRNDIFNLYQSDKKYKAGIDKLINARAATMKADYLAQMRRDGGMRIADEKALDRMLHAKAQDAVLGELVEKRIGERKSSKEYANLEQKAINGAGDAAMNTFLTEGLKYGFVNNLGYRKFLYTNPAGLSKKLSSSLKGLKEMTTEGGKQRLVTETSKFLTRGEKLKEFGKTLGSQVWGGAWTNGTDDMQVDAAERINEDSFNKYLDAYQHGKALASTYSFADGLYSYVKGLQNSLGQSTTWNSAAVGGLGSVLSFTPNITNIARLATKEGREAYRDNFSKEVERDKDGIPVRNEDGSVKYKDLNRGDNWRERFNYFIQNGVLNTYYGKKQAERDLQNHADFVNNILDEYRDFEDINHLVASNMTAENYLNIGDQKTANFIKAFNAVNTLNNLGNNSSDPATMSSVVQNAKDLINKYAQLNDVVEGKENPFSEEEINSLLSQYYAANPSLEQNDYNSQKALYNIAQNAQKLQEATEAYNNASKEIDKIESNEGITVDPTVKWNLMMQKALVGHWQDRKEKMQSEINDASSDDIAMDANTYIASVGGRKNAQTLVKVYNRQQKELETELADIKKKTAKLQENFDKATKEYKEAYAHGEWFDTDDATLQAEKKVKNAKAELDNSKMQEDFIGGMITRTTNKRKSLEMDMSNMNLDETTRRVALAQEELEKYQSKLNSLREERKKYVKKNGERDARYSPEKLADIDKSIEDYEKNVASRKETLERNKEKVLTADEIFSLDPVSRARMMSKENRSLYSKEQQGEIERLEQRLVMKDADALQKVQDIALLTQRINASQDAYNKMASNPLAASKAFEEQNIMATREAAGIIDQHNAETIASIIKMYDISARLKDDVDANSMNDLAYKMLRQYNSKLLDIIDEDKMLPEYQLQLDKAKEWSKMTEDIDAIIYNSDRSSEAQENLHNNIKNVLDNIDSKDNVLPTLEKVVDDTDGTEASKDVEYILKGLQNLGYQRDATILENRKKRKEREAEEAKKRGEEQKKAENEAKEAAEKKVESNDDMGRVPNKEGDILESASDVFDLDEDSKELPEENKTSKDDRDNASTIETKPKTVDDEDLQQTPNGVIDGKLLMSDNYGNGQIGFGDMHYGNDGKKGNFIASREGDKITFTIDGERMSLEINPEEYEETNDAKTPQHKEGTYSDKELQIAKDFEEARKYIWNSDWDVKDKGVDILGKYMPKATLRYFLTNNATLNSDRWRKSLERSRKDAANGGIKDIEAYALVLEFLAASHGDNTARSAKSFLGESEKSSGSKENRIFNANSLQKIDGDWYFNGTFAGNNKQTQVKANKNFDIDKAIERQQDARKAELAVQGVDVKNPNIIDNGDSVQGVSPSIEQQASEVDVEGKDVQVSDITTDVDNLNSIGESSIETASSTLSGNAMSRYDMEPLVSDGKIVLKKGKDSRKAMDGYYAWMNAAGIKLQNIIDHELARIIRANPHAKVKFLIVNPQTNATHDDYMRNHLLLVLDYDSKINKGITSIHDDANGGVIDFDGKKYLTIGVAGYGANNPSMRKSWYRIWNRNTSSSTPSPIRDLGLVIPQRAKYLKEHPNDRFYVAEDYTTEIVPTSQIPGYIVRQMVGDESVEYRSVRALLKDDKRNPMHYDFKNLSWGIQELTQFLVVGTSLDNVMVPRNTIRNSGSAFVLMPASNGKMVPSYLKPLMYTEMKDGALKNKVNDLLQSLVSPDYKTRYEATMQLSNIFYFDKDHDFILLSKNKPIVSLTHEGRVFKTFVLNSDFDRGEFIKAIEEMNPRVNITAKVLQSQDLLNEYDEAGALQTDAAMFGTAGSSYSIYALDEEGRMMMPETPVNNIPKSSNSDFKNGDRSQVVFRQDYYTYQESDGNFYHNGKLVTDEKDIAQLQYNKRIIDDGLAPVSSKGVWDNYILSTGENPEVIKVNRNTKEVKRLSQEDAKELIKRLEEEKAKKEREAKSLKEVELEDKVKEGTLPEIVSDLQDSNEESNDYVDPVTGEIVPKSAIAIGQADNKDISKKPLLDVEPIDEVEWMRQHPGQTPTSKDLFGKPHVEAQLGKKVSTSVLGITDKGVRMVRTDYEGGYTIKAEGNKGDYIEQTYYPDGQLMTNVQYDIGMNSSQLSKYITFDEDGVPYSTVDSAISNLMENLTSNDQVSTNTENIVESKQKSDTQSFSKLMNNNEYRIRLRKLIKNKWKEASNKPSELEKFLREKNIEVDSIGTSKEDIEAWIKTIEDCR